MGGLSGLMQVPCPPNSHDIRHPESTLESYISKLGLGVHLPKLSVAKACSSQITVETSILLEKLYVSYLDTKTLNQASNMDFYRRIVRGLMQVPSSCKLINLAHDLPTTKDLEK